MNFRMLPLVLTLVPIHTAQAETEPCFDRTLAITRYHYVNPGSIEDNWQDIYEITLSAGNVSSVTRLSKGAITIPRYDSSSPTYSPDGMRIAYIEADAGGSNARVKVMDAVDSDADLQGDNASVLESTDVDIVSIDWAADNRIVFGRFDAAGDTQIASAVLSGSTLGAISTHTADSDYPDYPKFLANNQIIYDADGETIKHIDLTSNVVSTLSGPAPRDRRASGHALGADIYFARIVPPTLDLWKARLNADLSLSNVTALISSTDVSETAPMVSDDGACLAYLASDLSVTYGPNSDLWIRDLTSGETRQITKTRDLAGAVWKP